jgi:hypothetical protein
VRDCIVVPRFQPGADARGRGIGYRMATHSQQLGSHRGAGGSGAAGARHRYQCLER